MTPYQLDRIINGIPVYFYKRPADGTIYASIHDYRRFNAEPLHMIRVPAAKIGDGWSVDTCPVVTAALAKARVMYGSSK